MYKMSWKRVSDGRFIRDEYYNTLEEALTKAQEPIAVFSKPDLEASVPIEVIVTNPHGKVVFSTAGDDA
jgi:hypothetical protein